MAGGILLRNWQIIASFFAFALVCDEVKAGEKEDVLARMAELYSAINAGDVDAIPLTAHTRFNVEGGLISTLSASDQAQRKVELKGAFAAGLKVNVETFHENADVYGNTAVFTCYERVNINPPEGEPVNGTRRVTVVLVKEKDEWDFVHVHLSYLKPLNPE